MHTPEQIAEMIAELENCWSERGHVQVPDKLANRILAALREFERERREFVAIPRMEE